MGADNLTPFTFQADIMNGTDPSPQNTALQDSLFTQHKVKVFLYNQQVTDSLTESFIKLADENNIPVVGVHETMPTPGYDYQSWMLAEVNALKKAVTDKIVYVAREAEPSPVTSSTPTGRSDPSSASSPPASP